MSKGGGAGKVYFVLYLAVVLELLIIIVERDEAEEHLHKKTQEAMRIVESILSQLQSGAGTEGINTRPQDEITLIPSNVNVKEALGTDIKSDRIYFVEVGVTEIAASLRKKEEESSKEYELRLSKLVELANVEELEYQILFNPDQNPTQAPDFPSDAELQKNNIVLDSNKINQRIVVPNYPEWEFIGFMKLKLDKKSTVKQINTDNISMEQFEPVYPVGGVSKYGNYCAPSGVHPDSIFHYVTDTNRAKHTKLSKLQKRVFAVHFQPQGQGGWYKLRFASRTNRILGVRKDINKQYVSVDDIPDEYKVNIGTVQLSVSDLKKVKKELINTLDGYGLPDANDLFEDSGIFEFEKAIDEAKLKAAASSDKDREQLVSKIDLYSYIAKLLVPGASINFDQNRGNIEFNVRVNKVEPKPNDPVLNMPEKVFTFSNAPAVFQFSISPYQSTGNLIEGRVVDERGAQVAMIRETALDQIAGLGVSAPSFGAKREFRGVIDKALPAGSYKIEISHKLSGKAASNVAYLEIFDTKIEKESDFKGRIDAFASYGNSLMFTYPEPSKGKIQTNQFKVYLSSDKSQDKKEVTGTVVKMGEFNCTPDIKSANVKIVWVQPFTFQEYTLFDEGFKIKQEAPVLDKPIIYVSECPGTLSKFKVRIDEIRILRPSASEKEFANVRIEVTGSPTIEDGLKGYTFATEPMLQGDEKTGMYTMEFEISGKPEKNMSKVTSTLSVPCKIWAENQLNGVRSDKLDASIIIQMTCSPEKGKKPRGR